MFVRPEWDVVTDDVGISSRLREEIDRGIAISLEQFEKGRGKTLDDEFIREFAKKARERSLRLLNKGL
uniref:Uncharacterized protein n=1 Tax=Candidatus Kentrum sp. DK TaxID=2126562 RepID=A0A450T1D7_9GAMM|nr:MAG: hypothetical protein BECKDK2373C_GA0170839_108010 [Candidatus Kentron sp. DK]